MNKGGETVKERVTETEKNDREKRTDGERD